MNFKSESLIEQFLDSSLTERLIAEVVGANQRFNLYSRNLKETDLRTLIGESLIPCALGLINSESGPILDIGSGWGIPALPWLIAYPRLDLTFLERSGKKSDFIALTLSRLGLKAGSIPLDLASFSSVESNNRFCLFSSRQVTIGQREIKQMLRLAAPDASLILINPPEESHQEIAADFPSEVIEYRLDDQPCKTILKIELN